MIYFNHAAASYPKIPEVKEAVANYLEHLPASPFRSGRSEPSGLYESCKERLGKLFQIEDYERIIFTSGATEAANLLIRGLPLEGKTVLVAPDVHNCILRPLYNREKPAMIRKLPFHSSGELDPGGLQEELKKGAYAVFINHCSNVTGRITDVGEIAALCREYGALLFVDVSQSAGCIPIDMDKWKADGLLFTAHKSLLGIEGLGGFYVRKRNLIKPVKFGGTGKDGGVLFYTDEKEAVFEVGTQNGPAIAALNASLEAILSVTVEEISRREEEMISYLCKQLKAIRGLELYDGGYGTQGPVLSFCIKGLSVSDIGYILENSYDIIVRTGLHCAPLIHEQLGTQNEGTVRISISVLTKWEEICAFVKAVKEIAGSFCTSSE